MQNQKQTQREITLSNHLTIKKPHMHMKNTISSAISKSKD
jgi:hypothetical protein